MKILIVGASSFIGENVFNYLLIHTEYEIIGTYFKNKKKDDFLFLDITDKNQVGIILEQLRPDIILWIAGSKNIKECEKSIELSKKINTFPVNNCIDIIVEKKINTHFIFFSTDYVFDGINGNFNDNDLPNPKTNYGLSNYLAEKSIKKSSGLYTIIRTSAVMGNGGTFFDWLINGLTNNETIELFDDVFFSPTPISLLNENILHVINKRVFGTIHISGNRKLNRYEFAKTVKKLIISSNSVLNPIQSNAMNQLYQRDLSLIPSLCCVQQEDLESYLKREILE